VDKQRKIRIIEGNGKKNKTGRKVRIKILKRSN
jgi:hypothetical protein